MRKVQSTEAAAKAKGSTPARLPDQLTFRYARPPLLERKSAELTLEGKTDGIKTRVTVGRQITVMALVGDGPAYPERLIKHDELERLIAHFEQGKVSTTDSESGKKITVSGLHELPQVDEFSRALYERRDQLQGMTQERGAASSFDLGVPLAKSARLSEAERAYEAASAAYDGAEVAFLNSCRPGKDAVLPLRDAMNKALSTLREARIALSAARAAEARRGSPQAVPALIEGGGLSTGAAQQHSPAVTEASRLLGVADGYARELEGNLMKLLAAGKPDPAALMGVRTEAFRTREEISRAIDDLIRARQNLSRARVQVANRGGAGTTA
jgi:hypothetical protein